MIEYIILSYVNHFKKFDAYHISTVINEPLILITETFLKLLEKKEIIETQNGNEFEKHFEISETYKGNPRIDWVMWAKESTKVDDEFHSGKTYSGPISNKGLPVFSSVEEVHSFLELDKLDITGYTTFYISGKSKTREITAPGRNLKKRQRWILNNILSCTDCQPCVHGFIPSKSIVTNASAHIGSDVVACLDISDFFPSIDSNQVRNAFINLGYSYEVANCLTELCTHNEQLPQGAPTSPMLANIIFSETDRKLLDFLSGKDITYTRYADDLTFSGNDNIDKYLPEIIKIIRKSGWVINDKKTHISRGSQRKMVTGLIVTDNGVKVPKRFKREFRKELFFCKKYGVEGHLNAIGKDVAVNFKEYLFGKAYFIKMVEPELGKQYLNELDYIFGISNSETEFELLSEEFCMMLDYYYDTTNSQSYLDACVAMFDSTHDFFCSQLQLANVNLSDDYAVIRQKIHDYEESSNEVYSLFREWILSKDYESGISFFKNLNAGY